MREKTWKSALNLVSNFTCKLRGTETNLDDFPAPAARKTKAEIVQYLKDSFALGHRAISGVTSENEVTPLPKPVSPFLSTRLAIAIIGSFHPKDHYGQMVEYLRMNGIVPPASRPRPQQQQSSQPKPQK